MHDKKNQIDKAYASKFLKDQFMHEKLGFKTINHA